MVISMDNIIVINGHVSRLETRLSDSPWEDAGSRGSCYDQPGMPVPPVLNICPYPAVAPEAPSEATPDVTPILDIHPYPAVVSEAALEAPSSPTDADGEAEGPDGGDIQPGSVCEPATDGETPEATDTPDRKRRSRKFAQEHQKIIDMPDDLALPSRKEYLNAITTIENKTAYLQPIQRAVLDGLTFEDGVMYFNGMPASQVNLVQYYDKTPQAVAELDTITLNGLYAALLKDTEKRANSLQAIADMINDPNYLTHSVALYVPDLLQKMGHGRNIGKSNIRALVNKLASYSNIYGIMKENALGKTFDVLLPVMQFQLYREMTNHILFSAPYLNMLVLQILKASYLSPKDGKLKLKRNGEPVTFPVNSYVVKSSIINERNKRAAQIVCVLATLIERTGGGLPNITYDELIDRCPSMWNAMDAATASDKNKILNRVFSKAWELLRTQTHLEEKYEGIQLPTEIPTVSKLGKKLEIPKNGKDKKDPS